jgi:hypothetical protein
MTRVQLLAVFLVIAAVLVAAAQLMLWAVDRVVFGNLSSLNLVCFALRGGELVWNQSLAGTTGTA